MGSYMYMAYTPAVATAGSILLSQGWYISIVGSILVSQGWYILAIIVSECI